MIDKDLFETVEEVFDSATLMSLLALVRRKVIYELKGVVSTGKEARVYWGKSRDGSDLAVKIYLTTTSEFRKSMVKYIAGDPRFDKSIPKSTKRLVYLWARKEFRNYKLMHEARVSVPRPIAQQDNILVMEFIGEEGKRAPLLKEVELDLDEYERIMVNIIEDLRKMYLNARLVHGDLSEYNVMIWRGRHFIIDVSQAVKLAHPNAEDFLLRDIRNILRFFSDEVGLETPDFREVFNYVTGRSDRLKW